MKFLLIGLLLATLSAAHLMAWTAGIPAGILNKLSKPPSAPAQKVVRVIKGPPTHRVRSSAAPANADPPVPACLPNHSNLIALSTLVHENAIGMLEDEATLKAVKAYHSNDPACGQPHQDYAKALNSVLTSRVALKNLATKYGELHAGVCEASGASDAQYAMARPTGIADPSGKVAEEWRKFNEAKRELSRAQEECRQWSIVAETACSGLEDFVAKREKSGARVRNEL